MELIYQGKLCVFLQLLSIVEAFRHFSSLLLLAKFVFDNYALTEHSLQQHDG